MRGPPDGDPGCNPKAGGECREVHGNAVAEGHNDQDDDPCQEAAGNGPAYPEQCLVETCAHGGFGDDDAGEDAGPDAGPVECRYEDPAEGYCQAAFEGVPQCRGVGKGTGRSEEWSGFRGIQARWLWIRIGHEKGEVCMHALKCPVDFTQGGQDCSARRSKSFIPTGKIGVSGPWGTMCGEGLRGAKTLGGDRVEHGSHCGRHLPVRGAFKPDGRTHEPIDLNDEGDQVRMPAPKGRMAHLGIGNQVEVTAEVAGGQGITAGIERASRGGDGFHDVANPVEFGGEVVEQHVLGIIGPEDHLGRGSHNDP